MEPGPPKLSLKRAAKLKQKKHRETERRFLAEGQSLVEEASVPSLYTFVEQEDVARLSSLETPTGPVGVFAFLDVAVEELLEGQDRLVLLHGVQDPGNVGTVIRTAHAFGAGVALSKGCADLYNSKTVRATMGSIFHAPVAREVRSIELLDQARNSGFVSHAAVPEGGEPSRPAMSGKSLVVVGSEGSGLPEEVEAACDKRVSILAEASSLNAAVAASILLYEAYGVC